MANPNDKEKKAAAPKKRGNQGDFHSQREQFMKSWLDDFLDASKNKTTGIFFAKFFFDYWMRFP
jgi:hypothetical protein